MSEPRKLRFFRVRGLETRQHYKDRNPPWIKLHADRLDDPAFRDLPDTAKAHLILLEICASRAGNRVPFRQESLRNRIGARRRIDFALLERQGFIEFFDSEPLAERSKGAGTETETETEIETNASAASAAPRPPAAPPPPPAPEPPAPAVNRTATATAATDKTATAMVPAPVPAAVAVRAPEPTDPECCAEACGDWIARLGGTAPGARIMRALRPLWRKYTWAVVRPVWQKYLAEQDPQFISPENFAQRFGLWARGKDFGKPSVADDANVRAFLEGATAKRVYVHPSDKEPSK